MKAGCIMVSLLFSAVFAVPDGNANSNSVSGNHGKEEYVAKLQELRDTLQQLLDKSGSAPNSSPVSPSANPPGPSQAPSQAPDTTTSTTTSTVSSPEPQNEKLSVESLKGSNVNYSIVTPIVVASLIVILVGAIIVKKRSFKKPPTFVSYRSSMSSQDSSRSNVSNVSDAPSVCVWNNKDEPNANTNGENVMVSNVDQFEQDLRYQSITEDYINSVAFEETSEYDIADLAQFQRKLSSKEYPRRRSSVAMASPTLDEVHSSASSYFQKRLSKDLDMI